MKISAKIVVVLSFAAGAILFVIGSPSQAHELYIGETADASRTLYRQNCASCHGKDGRSQTKKGRETEADDLTTSDVKGDSHDKIVRVITNGKGEMPGFKRKLSSAQIASIAKYIKTL